MFYGWKTSITKCYRTTISDIVTPSYNHYVLLQNKSSNVSIMLSKLNINMEFTGILLLC